MVASPKAVSVREFNKQAKQLVQLSGDLDICQEALEIEKAKAKKLRKRVSEVREACELELRSMRNSCYDKLASMRDQAEQLVEETKVAMRHRYENQAVENAKTIQELREIQDGMRRDNEHLRLILKKDIKIPGNLEKMEEEFRLAKHLHFQNGGGAGSI